MITKTVTGGQRSATATISEETKFIFSDAWNFYHVQNLGEGVVRVSMSAGATAGADGTIAIPAGGAACTSHNYPANSVYITAENTSDAVQVIGSNTAISPFKSAQKGGGADTSIIDTILRGYGACAYCTFPDRFSRVYYGEYGYFIESNSSYWLANCELIIETYSNGRVYENYVSGNYGISRHYLRIGDWRD